MRIMKNSEELGAREAIIETLASLAKKEKVLSTLEESDVEEIVDLLIYSETEPDPRKARKKLTKLIHKIAQRS